MPGACSGRGPPGFKIQIPARAGVPGGTGRRMGNAVTAQTGVPDDGQEPGPIVGDDADGGSQP